MENQLELFPALFFEKTSDKNYQIKRFDNFHFKMNLVIDENQDPEVLALEHLGYFVVPEINISDGIL